MKHDKFKKNVLPLVDRLFRLAISITGNREDAEDVVQDTLFQVLQKNDDADSIRNIEAYCFRSARNIAIDKISLKDNRQEAIPEHFDVPETRLNIQECMEEDEQAQMLEKCIGELPEKQRAVFQLRTVEGFSYKQIADAMNVSEEQVKVNLFRARQRLKDFFEQYK